MSDIIDEILGGIERADDAYVEDIKKYWRISTGQDSLAKMFLEPLVGLKQKLTKVPDQEWKDLIDEYNISAMEGDFVNQFMKHFTHDELKSLLKLYDEHPVLKKVKEHTKEITGDTIKLNDKWTMKFINLFHQKIAKWNEMGYVDPDDM